MDILTTGVCVSEMVEGITSKGLHCTYLTMLRSM